VTFLNDQREPSATPTDRIRQRRTNRRVNSRGDSVITVNTRVLSLVRGETVMNGIDSVTTIDTRKDGTPYRITHETRRYDNVTFANAESKRSWPVGGMVLLSMDNRIFVRGVERHYEANSVVHFDGSAHAQLLGAHGVSTKINLPARTIEMRPNMSL
jgi:hypothetical protein